MISDMLVGNIGASLSQKEEIQRMIKVFDEHRLKHEFRNRFEKIEPFDNLTKDKDEGKRILKYIISLVDNAKQSAMVVLCLKRFIQQNYFDLLEDSYIDADMDEERMKKIIKYKIIPKCKIPKKDLKRVYNVVDCMFSQEELIFLCSILYDSTFRFRLVVDIVFKLLLRCHMFHSYITLQDTRIMDFTLNNKYVFMGSPNRIQYLRNSNTRSYVETDFNFIVNDMDMLFNITRLI